MSKWSYAKGIIEVMPYGRTQAECRYILETVLAHLPKVTGSEEDMYTHIIQHSGHNVACSHDEFSNLSNLNKWFEYQEYYTIVIEGYFRDREFDETYRSFVKWLIRFAKRVYVQSCFVKVSGVTEDWEQKSAIIDMGDRLKDMFEWYSWCGEGTVNWCEYLMWQPPRNKKGIQLCGKPDFSDGACLEMMSERERNKRLYPKWRGKKR